MYPNLYFAFLDLLDWDLPALKLINSFGFFVALAFLVAHALLRKELKRQADLGHFQSQTTTAVVGQAPHPLDLGLQAVMGFVLGWKVLYLVFNAGEIFQDGGLPQAHLFSTDGNVVWGVLGAVGMTAWRYMEVQRERLPEPKTVEQVIRPEDLVGGITAAAAVGGIVGAKLFHLLEYPDEFIAFLKQPSLNAFLGGLTIYGGLIVGGLSVYVFARRHKMNFLRLADATAPVLLLAYGIGGWDAKSAATAIGASPTLSPNRDGCHGRRIGFGPTPTPTTSTLCTDLVPRATRASSSIRPRSLGQPLRATERTSTPPCSPPRFTRPRPR